MGRIGFGWLRIVSSGGFYEHGNEPSIFFDKLNDNQVFK
jgi:hypothetical protein